MTSSESVRLSSGLPSSTRREGSSVVCMAPSSVVSVSRSSSLMTPCSASNRLVILGDRFGDIGDPSLGVESRDSGVFLPSPSVELEEGKWMEDFGTLILTSWRNEQESENRHLPCE